MPIEGVNLGVVGIGSGWALVTVFVLMLFRGSVITGREARALQRRLDAAEEREAIKDQTIANFRESVDTSNQLIRAVLDVAQERS